MGEILGPGATMIELRRSRVHQFREEQGLVTLHELTNAYALWQEKNDDTRLMTLIQPVEHALSELKSVLSSATLQLTQCATGRSLPFLEFCKYRRACKKNDLVAVYTQKGEAVSTCRDPDVRR